MEKSRPFGVTVLAILSGFLAVIAVLATLSWLGLLPFLGIPGRQFNLWNALLWGLLAWVWIWLTQMLWQVDPQAWIFLAVITVFNLTLDFIYIITGPVWVDVQASVIVNALILIYIMLPGVRKAFGQT